MSGGGGGASRLCETRPLLESLGQRSSRSRSRLEARKPSRVKAQAQTER